MHRYLLTLAVFLLGSAVCPTADADPTVYTPISPSAADRDRTIVLDGISLSIADVLAVARGGAKVQFAAQVFRDSEARRGLVAQAAAQKMAVYGVNRGGGALREQAAAPPPGTKLPGTNSRLGALPEIDDEALVRATLVIHANHFAFGRASSDYLRAMIALLNADVTPVMYARGTLSEGDLWVFSNYQATMQGRGFAYYHGKRMPAADALAKAGLAVYRGAIDPYTTNAYTTALALLLVEEGTRALEWSDLALSIDLLGMNSSVTPLVPLVQGRRPFPWITWEAAKQLDLLRGSYLFEDDPKRILQDPESLRASYIRLGAAWEALDRLRASVLLQMNSGESNPGEFLDAKPTDHWSLATPWLMRQHVEGGPLSNGHSGYVLSNANWDAYPMLNDVEGFSIALANMAVTVPQRIERFSDRGPVAFFTGIKPADVLTREQYENSPYVSEPYFIYLDVWKEIQSLTQSLPPDASATDFGVADLEGMGRLKASRGRQAVDLYMQLLAYDLMTGAYWLDVRKAQDGRRTFGTAPTAAWQALRTVLPWQSKPDDRPDLPYAVTTYGFMKDHPAAAFMGDLPPPPRAELRPVAK